MTVHVKKKEEKVIKKEENLKELKDDLRIEIFAVLTLLSITLTSDASKILGLEKICFSGYWGQNICYQLKKQNSWNSFRDGQIYDFYAGHFMWWTAVQILFSCLVLAFLGGWSDKTGRRKIILALPVVGVFLQIINGFISTIFFHELPFTLFFFFDAVFGSIVGYSTVFLGFFIYLYDVTTVENRVNRFTTVLLCALAGVALGSVLSRLLLHYMGYYMAYLVAFTTNMINRRHIKKKLEDPVRTNEQIMYDEQDFRKCLKTFFEWSTIKETAKAVTKKEPNKRNVYMYIYLATLFILFVSVFGERSIFDLIARFDYNWNSATINVFYFYSIITTILGIWIANALIIKRFNHHEAVIGITSCISKILSSFVFAFAAPDDVFYLGPAIDALNGTGLLAIVFMITKLLQRHEIGKIAALIGLVENGARMLYVTLYYFMYSSVMFPGGIYLVGAGVTVPALIAFIWILRKAKREETLQTTTEDSAVNI